MATRRRCRVLREAFGCDAIAITDHATATSGPNAGILDAIDGTPAHPNTILLGGGGNVPPWNGEHATKLGRHGGTKAETQARFDDLKRTTHSASLAVAGLQWRR